MGVRTEGLYTVTADEVATAMGLSSASVFSSFQGTNLLVTSQGERILCSVTNDQLFFYGVPAFSKRAPENVYWLELNTESPAAPWPPVSPPTSDWVMGTNTLQGLLVSSYSTLGTLTNLPSFLAFSLITAGKSFSVTNTWSDGVTNPVAGEISVTLLSASNGETTPDQHSARVSVNDVVVGTPSWDNESYQSFVYFVPGDLLTNGMAVIRVENRVASGTSARFFWTKLALTAARRTDVQQPVLRPSMRGVLDADGSAADNVADYVALIPPEGWVDGFRETIQPLMDFRSRQGLRTAVLDVEALYNRYTYGLADPEAIRAFCRRAYMAPEIKLRYLLLAGSGSLDFAHEKYAATNYQACLIPPLLASQRFETGETMIVAVDQAFGDVFGDSAPEIAVGRLPTAWTQELAVAVAKTLAYEEALPWKIKAALSAGSSFTQDMNSVKGLLLAAGKTVSTFYPATTTVWNDAFKSALQDGIGVFWFIGHSSTQLLGESSLDPLINVSRLKTTSWTQMPIGILLGCRLNEWQTIMTVPVADAASLGPFSVFYSAGGFSAVLASTGYVWDGVIGPSGETQMLGLYLSECSASNGVLRIGDAICSALQRLVLYDPPINPIRPYYDPPPITAERLQSYSLVGDPAMTWRHDYSATGTPVSWLLSHGLTAWDGDVSDLDGDGWKAWQEYQAGTRPDTNRFQIAVQALDKDTGAIVLTFETEASKSYRILWKYALEGSAPWEPISWTWAGETEDPNPASELIIPSAPMSSITIPLRPEYTQGFFKIQQAE